MSTRRTAPRTAPDGTRRAVVPAAGVRGRETGTGAGGAAGGGRELEAGPAAGVPVPHTVEGRIGHPQTLLIGSTLGGLAHHPGSNTRSDQGQTDIPGMARNETTEPPTTTPTTRAAYATLHTTPHRKAHPMATKTTTDRQPNRTNTGRMVRVPDPLWEEFGEYAHDKLGVSSAERIRYLMQRDLDQSKG